MSQPIPDEADMMRAALEAAPHQTVAGVDRFAHFVVNRREDGELDRLGAGAMGITYRAFDTRLERLVALKTIHPQWVDDPEVRSRFAREAKAAARLQHPHIASVLYQGEEASVCFYAMELVVGEDLHHYIRRVGPLSSVHALKMAHQIALALVAASREGVIHRDLKPANVMVTSYHDGGEPHLKVIDFGLAKVIADTSATFSTSGFMGTPEFASPEQCKEQTLDVRSDIYSLGGILWFLLTGASPFTGSLLAVIRAQISVQPAWEKLPGAPIPLLVILRRLMAKQRELRPGSALEAAQEIELAIQTLSLDRRNFLPLASALGSSDSAGARSNFAATVASHASGATPEAAPKKAAREWLVPAVISLCCFVGGIYGWQASRNHRAAAPNAPVPEATEPLPSITAPDIATTPPAGLREASYNTPAAAGPGHSPESARPPHASADFTNSLGMRFIRPAASPILASVWETRVNDFAAYAAESTMLTNIANDRSQRSWRNPGFPQNGDHPVVYVSPPDAVAFCRWLTEKEHRAGVLPAGEYYRLPTRLEWDALLSGAPVQNMPDALPGTPAPQSAAAGSGWKPGDPPPVPTNWKPGDPPQVPPIGGPAIRFRPAGGRACHCRMAAPPVRALPFGRRSPPRPLFRRRRSRFPGQ